MHKNWLTRGITLVEILGAATLVMALASVAVISVKDSLQAGQRSAIQRELQSLNTALNNFRAAGGVIDDGSSAEDAIRRMRYGVGVSDMESYAPLTEDPDWLRKIGGETFRLDYNENDGFTYLPDSGEGPAFGDAGRETNALGLAAFDFDPSDRESALGALNSLGELNPEDPTFGSTLDALNAAYSMGTLTDADMQAAGLVKYGNEWMTPSMAQTNHAQDALEALSTGGGWGTLNVDQQRAYANVYPEAAVENGKAEALNLMDPTILTRDLVQGYGNVGGQWLTPTAVSAPPFSWASGSATADLHILTVTQIPLASMVTPVSDQHVYIQLDPLGPAIYVGRIHQIYADTPWPWSDGTNTYTQQPLLKADIIQDPYLYNMTTYPSDGVGFSSLTLNRAYFDPSVPWGSGPTSGLGGMVQYTEQPVFFTSTVGPSY